MRLFTRSTQIPSYERNDSDSLQFWLWLSPCDVLCLHAWECNIHVSGHVGVSARPNNGYGFRRASERPTRWKYALKCASAVLSHVHYHSATSELADANSVRGFFFNFIGWGEIESTWYCGHYWPILPAPDDIWRWVWSRIAGETEVLGENLPQSLYPPQIPHDLTWAQTQITTVGGRKIIAWVYGTTCVS
jgi:hypothetical protein